MVFTKRLRERIRSGRIRCSVRVWTRPHVKAGGRYAMDDGSIVVNSIAPIAVGDITYDLARESGFDSVDDLLQMARHGRGDNVYLIRFHYLPPGAWVTPMPKRARTDEAALSDHSFGSPWHKWFFFGASTSAATEPSGRPCLAEQLQHLGAVNIGAAEALS